MVRIYYDGSWTIEELKRFAKGEMIDRNGKRYAMCRECNTVVRIDKPIFGSIHICK